VSLNQIWIPPAKLKFFGRSDRHLSKLFEPNRDLLEPLIVQVDASAPRNRPRAWNRPRPRWRSSPRPARPLSGPLRRP